MIAKSTWILLAFVVMTPAATQPLELRGKQLFVDDYVIERLDGLERTMHRPVRHPGNPILTGTEAWEKWLIGVNGRCVLYDEATHQFRMWYGTYLVEDDAPQRTRYRVCYATSSDGVHWTRPVLGKVEWAGTRNNNILPWGENWMRRPNIIEDARDPDPARRYKMTYVDVMGGRPAIVRAYSPDGIDWKLNADGKPWFRNAHNSNLLGWDPRVGRYVFFPRMPGDLNAVGRSTSEDFVSWSEPQTVLAPAASDGLANFKGLAAFFHDDLYLGWLWVFRRNKPSDSQVADVELASSRDGEHWKRYSPGTPFLDHGQPGAWDSEGLIVVAPVVHDDRIWIYYNGWNVPYGFDAEPRVMQGWVEHGQRKQHAIGLATLRADGFVSLEAGRGAGTLTTKLLTAPAGRLMLNARVRGGLRAEVLDSAGNPVPGYTSAECVPVRADGARLPLGWKGRSDLDELRGRAVRLRFTLRDGGLYAFWFDPS